MSLDASYLSRKMEAHRDYVLMGGGGVVAGAIYTAYAAQQALGVAAIGASVLIAVSAGYSAVKVYQHARGKDREIEQLAMATDQQVPVRNLMGLMPASQVTKVIAQGELSRPDMVSAIAQRRARRWEAVMDPGYRPPVRRAPNAK